MDILHALTLMGGLAFFLYGMELMGASLTKMSGRNLQRILEGLTDNVWKGILLGTVITAIIQSSSGTTVMVVSLVNSGVMKLSGAIGVIMGANIGTTVTAWILSLTGLESSNLYVQMLKPTYFSPVLAMLGVIFIMFSKREKRQMLGRMLIGFAILMFGMDVMSGAMKPLSQTPEFQKLFVSFSNPVLGVLVGAVLTAVIQSSSASVGILQALCATGIVHLSSAIPIIMGQNIGTCITAALSAIGAKRNARRAAAIHLSFNIIGTLIFLILYYSGDALFSFHIADRLATPVSIAVIHSVFNIANTLLLGNFTGLLEKIAFLVFPLSEKEKLDMEDEFRLLDERLLVNPGIALQQAWKVSIEMLEKSAEALDAAMGLLFRFDMEQYEKVRALEQKADRYQDRLGDYLLKITTMELTDENNKSLSIIMNGTTDFERISDLALDIAMQAKKMDGTELRFSDLALRELEVYRRALSDIVHLTLEAYRDEDEDKARCIEPLEEVIDRLDESIRIRHVERLRAGICSIEMGLLLTDVSTSMERVSDHCSNIAVALIEIHAGLYDAHKYLRAVKEKDEGFRQKLKDYLARYQLPDDVPQASAAAVEPSAQPTL